nr:Major Facilitator Superfamily [uncultured bacterium]
MLAIWVKETLPPEKRIKPDIKAMGDAWRTLFADRAFIGMTFIGAFAITGVFIYLGNSAFVLSQHYGLSPRQYSLAFSANALAFFAATQLNGYLGNKYGMARLPIPAAAGFALTMCILAGLFVAGFDGFWVMACVLFVGFSFIGILLPTIMVLALENHGDIAGTAASLMNTVQMMIGATAIGVSGMLIKGSPTMMIVCIAGLSLATLACTFGTFKKK